jgi:hypothetical protein
MLDVGGSGRLATRAGEHVASKGMIVKMKK